MSTEISPEGSDVGSLKVLSVLGYLLMGLPLAGLIVYRAILATNPLGAAIQVLAVVLMIWARLTFGGRSFHAAANPTEGGLVTTGPYRFLRHPIYAAVLYFTWAAVSSHPSLGSFAAGCLVILGVSIRVWAEERLVIRKYPDYREYAARTRRFIPFVF